MLYTRKGDDGTTKMFGSKPGKRISKSSCQTESLGALDELNSFLGLVKVKSQGLDWKIQKPEETVAWVQNCLFIIQAEVAGADKKISKGQVRRLERLVDDGEEELPPMKTFSISGGTELAAIFDIARTLARKTERRIVGASEDKDIEVGKETLAFLNRLSSLFYVMARLSNYVSGINEVPPTY